MTLEDVPFAHIYLLDFEFSMPPGERPRPICLVARELRTEAEIRLWEDDLHRYAASPFPSGSLLVAYFASAEMASFLALGWVTTFAVLDLFVEFRRITNGRELPHGRGLLGALWHFGLPAMDVAHKDSMRSLALRGGPFTSDERAQLISYCREDVLALERLLPAILSPMAPDDLDRALLHGRYMRAVAAMEHAGIPLDVPMLHLLQEHWETLRNRLILELNTSYQTFVDGAFVESRWAAWLAARGIPWPKTERGRLKLDDDTFREAGRSYPEVETMRQLRHALSQLKLNDLTVGHDGRNRCNLSPFRSITGRNQPSTSKFIFGPSVWMRSLIMPQPGFAIVSIDWEQQEFGIAAYLSEDPAMIAAYESSDPYLKFAELAGAVPPGATKKTHPRQREMFKQCVLAVQYGMGIRALAWRLGCSVPEAAELLLLHRRIFERYWRWSDGVLDHALLFSRLHTVFGWTLGVGPEPNERSLRNFPMQSNGAEMMRIAAILATEDQLEVCAPIHDAFLVHVPEDDLENQVSRLQRHLTDASSLILGGPRLRTETQTFLHPGRYRDERGDQMWNTVQKLLQTAP